MYTRLPDESAKAYEAFLIYLQLGGDRSTQSVANSLKKSRSVIRKWSDRFNWVERARSWDANIEKEKLDSIKNRALEANDRHLEAARVLMRKGLKRLEKISEEDEKKLKAIDPYVALRMIAKAIDIERAALGLDDLPSIGEDSEAKKITEVRVTIRPGRVSVSSSPGKE